MTNAPAMLGRYRLVRSLARGGMGELFLAEATGEHGWAKRVALKTVLPHLGEDPEFIRRFLDEARIAAGLSHGTIVSVFDVGCDGGTWFIAMEYVDGPDLRRVLKALKARDARLPVPLALYVAGELAAALDVAHSATDDEGQNLGIVHRDVSPANVLLSRTGEVKLTDFGIAAARVRAARTETGRLRGTFPYISPEQASGGTVDARSDVYAVGTLLFELLSGQRAFDGDSDVEVLARVRNGERAALADLCPELPTAVCALVERALAVDAEQRIRSAAALREELLALLSDAGVNGRDDLSRWLEATFPGGAGLGATSAGPSLDDVLNAQLDAGAPASRTSSRSRPGTQSAAVGTRQLMVATDAKRRRPVGRTVAVALAAVVLAALGWALRPTSVELRVTSEPSGADVFLDGRPVGVSSMRTDVPRGEVQLTVRMDGYEAYARTLDLSSDEQIHVALTPTWPHVQFASVPPGAEVRIDDGPWFAAGNTSRAPVGRDVRVEMRLEGYTNLVEENVRFQPLDRIFTRTLAPVRADALVQSNDGTASEGTGTGARSPLAERGPVETDRENRASLSDAGEPSARVRDSLWRLPSLPADAVATVDGERVTSGEIRLAGDASPVELVIERPGFAPWRRTLRPGEGGRLEVSWPEEAPEPGIIVVRFFDPPAVGDIRIDGVSEGRSQSTREEFSRPPGEYRVEVTHESGRADAQVIRVRSGAETVFTVDWNDG